VAFVYIRGTVASPAACAATDSNGVVSFGIDLSKEGGKSALNAILLAQTLGQNVRLLGKGTCALWDTAHEDLYYADVRYP
jgi:hypothetical protein